MAGDTVTVIEWAISRRDEKDRQCDFGAVRYWAAYIDGARAQLRELERGMGCCSYLAAPKKTIALQEVIHAASHYGRARFRIQGDCMEEALIYDGGSVEVDFTRYPRPGRKENGQWVQGDPCIAYAVPPGTLDDDSLGIPLVMCKRYVCRHGWHMVGTAYREKMNGAFPAIAILGVVCASYKADGSVVWSKDRDLFPVSLPFFDTVHGGNCEGIYPVTTRKINGPKAELPGNEKDDWYVFTGNE